MSLTAVVDPLVQPTTVTLAPDSHDSFVVVQDDGSRSLSAFVRNIVCAACVQRIERVLHRAPGVVEARVNMTTHRLHLRWDPSVTGTQSLLDKLERAGYPAVPLLEDLRADGARADRRLLRCLAVAGFAAANVMLLSVGVWAGFDMGPATKSLLHWVSAMIAMPAVAYAGRPFFYSAVTALKARRLNMDVPISLAILLAVGLSVVQTLAGGDQVYFDASVSLLFFLLIGRYLDGRARSKARQVGEQLLALSATSATVIEDNGARRVLPVAHIEKGMRVEVLPGDQIPVDGSVLSGRSDVDLSVVNGETVPRAVGPGSEVFAGTVNRTGSLVVAVSGAGENTLLQEIVRLMEAAQQTRSGYVRLADRAAAVYAPLVHALALVAFVLWAFPLGFGAERGLLIAISVLIITCPCALGLAVPVVQVVASGALFRRGILLKEGDALERLAQVDTVVFDKTGTLTTGDLKLANADLIPHEDLVLAARLGAGSRHPLARAIARFAENREPLEVREEPGMGVEHTGMAGTVRLGSRIWCEVDLAVVPSGPELWLRRDDGRLTQFCFHDTLREDAVQALQELRKAGLDLSILSGDTAPAVEIAAHALGVSDWQAGCRPDEKIRVLQELAAEGRKVLMVGDGLNDAPSLRTAYVSMSPASAMYLSQTAADLVFQGDGLAAVPVAIRVARQSRRLILQNFSLAALYNAIAVPLAVAGLVTPLVAAVAMSSSSIVVTVNALRLRTRNGHAK
ncbi:MAG: heavy metal translocating P-type ATPase [Alphaproteobacteria bacterium]